jgi:hypothetical protein
MTMLRDIAAELIGMFLGDRGLALALLVVIGTAALVSGAGEAGSVLAGTLLALGCPLLLIENVIRAGRRGKPLHTRSACVGSASETP